MPASSKLSRNFKHIQSNSHNQQHWGLQLCLSLWEFRTSFKQFCHGKTEMWLLFVHFYWSKHVQRTWIWPVLSVHFWPGHSLATPKRLPSVERRFCCVQGKTTWETGEAVRTISSWRFQFQYSKYCITSGTFHDVSWWFHPFCSAFSRPALASQPFLP